MVVKLVEAVLACPAASTAVTVASYRLLVLRGLLGTQAEPSSRSAPSTALPEASLSATVVTLPPETVKPISALIGTSFLPVAGVTLSDSAPAVEADSGTTPADGGACEAPAPTQAAVGSSPSPQAASASGVTTANATTATTERRMLTILCPVLTFRLAHPALSTQHPVSSAGRV
nr:hypothetical protein GCM10020092_094240 [Actinoplanes digitatis]